MTSKGRVTDSMLLRPEEHELVHLWKPSNYKCVVLNLGPSLAPGSHCSIVVESVETADDVDIDPCA